MLDNLTPAIEVDCSGMLEGVEVVGYIDRVMIDPDGQPTVLDLKSNSRIPNNPQQLGLYSVMLELMGFPRALKGRYWWARSGELGPELDLSSFSYKGFAWEFTGTKAMRDAGFFKANTQSITCSFCGERPYCRAQNGHSAHLIPPAWETDPPQLKP